MSNDTGHDVLEARSPGCALVFGCVIVLGLPLNAVSLWIFLLRHSLNSSNAVFMVNLVISDLLLVISLPMRVYFYATGTWPLGYMACIWITMLFRNNIRSSSIFITFISVDRLLAVVYPLRARRLRTSSNAWKAAALVWLFVLMVNIPESVFFSVFLKNTTESSCFEFYPRPPHDFLMDVFLAVLVFILLAVNVVCTALVSWTLYRQLNDIARIYNKVNVMLIFVMNLMMFIIFFLPLSLRIFFKDEKNSSRLLSLASVNCCVDPLLYYFSFDGFWKQKEDADAPLPRE